MKLGIISLAFEMKEEVTLFKADKVFKSGIDTNERDFKVWTHDD
jgi:hypothetical protein